MSSRSVSIPADQALKDPKTFALKPKEYLANARIMNMTDKNWLAGLSAAPGVIKTLAFCMIAASAPTTQDIKIKLARTTSFKHGNEFLSANLQELVNVGQQSFSSAYGSMLEIMELTGTGKENCVLIFKGVNATQIDTAAVETGVSEVVKIASDCQGRAQDMYEKFSLWQQYVMDIDTAVNEAKGTNAEKYRVTESDLKAKEILKKQQEEREKEQSIRAKQRQERVDELYEKYFEALKDFPSGKEMLDMYVKATLVDALNNFASGIGTGLGAGLGAYAGAKANPMGALSNALGNQNNQNNQNQGGQGNQNQQSTTPASSISNDYLLSLSGPILGHIQDLDAILEGKDGVDWSLVTPTAQEVGKKKDVKKLELAVVLKLLETQETLIKQKPQEASSSTGKELLAVLTKSLKVAKELTAEGEKSRTVEKDTWKKPKKDDALVKGWKTDVQAAVTDAQKVVTRRDAAKGNPATVYMQTEVKEGNRVAGAGDLVKQRSENAKAKVESLQQVLLQTEKAADELKKTAKEYELDLMNTKLALTQLEDEKATLELVRGVLLDCILYLSEMKKHLGDLMKFFSGVKAAITSGGNVKLRGFVTHVNNSLARAGAGEIVQPLTRREIFNKALGSLATFDFYGQVADIFTRVCGGDADDGDKAAQYTIMSGFGMVNSIGTNLKKGEIAEKQKEIENWAKQARGHISGLVVQKLNEAVNDLQDRMAANKQLLESPDLPALPANKLAAIEHGMSQGRAVVENRLLTSNPALDILKKPQEERGEFRNALIEATDEAKLLKEQQEVTAEARQQFVAEGGELHDEDDDYYDV
ncbi:hypothetical protein BDV25DRAFT_143488 [Aspergillus avenaceus]|uniref:Uncharacterized protein n=1 Tax=Aspergillus avenaceus TaxID=36643 RepID=A0A5N6TJV9_ASPAV|nr:hypothetical protein BDV25DRAFT_143488 [Aspergillus avenaceus]